MHSSIRSYLRGKTILVTGGTGFLGKVLVERLLRHAPELARIHLLIRNQPNASATPSGALTRFETEVLTSGVFEPLARVHGARWPSFVREKIVPVAGDVSLPNLGLGAADHASLVSSVDVIVNAAASVTFDAPIDEALQHNTRSVQQIAAFARACRSAALVHVSTAYVAGRRNGTVAEGPLTPDISTTEIAALTDIVTAARGDEAAGHAGARETRERLVLEGMTRAKRLGWHDTYTYTKALGEMVLERERGDVPTVIVRPTIIESSLRDPEPGWLENLNVGDPLWVEYGRGRMPDFPYDRAVHFDFIPVDFVANALLALLPVAAEARTVGYYTVGSGALNPLTGGHLYELTRDYFMRHPMHDRHGEPIRPPQWTFPTSEQFRARYAGQPRRAATTRLLYLADLYETYLKSGCVFDTSNTQRLLDSLADTDRAALDFDVRRLDWRAYIQDVHLPGLRRHILREEKSRAHMAVRRHG